MFLRSFETFVGCIKVLNIKYQNPVSEAVDIVDNADKMAQKGHYRIKKTSLNKFLEAKKVKSLPVKSSHSSRSMMFPKVKNHLGL